MGANGPEMCWDCCNKAEREAFATQHRYCAYLAGDGKTITTWPGGELAKVTALWESGNNFAGKIMRFRATAPDSSRWYGTSPGKGMYARLRRNKANRD
jgi:hypothetical protein